MTPANSTSTTYRSVLDQAQDRLDAMKAVLEASARNPLSVGGPALPLGADPEGADDWQPGQDGLPAYRCVWSPPVARDVDIRAVVFQYLDGHVATEGDEAPTVYIGAEDYRTDDARRIAQKIIEVADLADRWAGIDASGAAVTEVTCGLDGCEYTHTDESTWCEHSWSDTAAAHTIVGTPHIVTVFAVVNDRHREPDEVCLAIQRDADDDHPKEVWLTTSEAERLGEMLGSAARRISAFRPRDNKAVTR